MLDTDEAVLHAARPDQFVDLNLNRRAIPVLRILNEKTVRKVMIVVPVLMTIAKGPSYG